MRFRFVPAGCTPVAQVLDTYVNRPFKHVVKQCYMEWALEETRRHLEDSNAPDKLDLSGANLKRQSLAWALKAWEHVSTMGEGIKGAYEKAGTMRVGRPSLLI